MKRKLGAIALALTMTFTITACGGKEDPGPGTEQTEPANPESETPKIEAIDYKIVTSEDLAAKEHTYRIIVDTSATEEQLVAIYNELNDSKYEELTLWFYSSQEAVDTGPYDLAMIERIGNTTEPTIKIK